MLPPSRGGEGQMENLSRCSHSVTPLAFQYESIRCLKCFEYSGVYTYYRYSVTLFACNLQHSYTRWIAIKGAPAPSLQSIHIHKRNYWRLFIKRILPWAVYDYPNCECCPPRFRIGSTECRTRSNHDRSRWRRRTVDRMQILKTTVFNNNKDVIKSYQNCIEILTCRVDDSRERAVKA